MKKTVVSFILFSFLTMMVFAQKAQQAEQANQTDAKGLRQGRWIEKAGEMIFDGNYVNNQKDGMWLVHFAENGLLAKIENFKLGLKEGIFIDLSKQGYLVSEQYFKKDIPDGPSRRYGQGGFQTSENNYAAGKYHGMQSTWYENSKKKSEESNYNNGIKDGPSRWFNAEGNLIAEYNYVQGMLQGEQKSFYPGNKLRTLDFYKDNINDGASIEYFENGKVKISGQYKSGEKDGKWIEFDENGAVVRTTTFAGGKEKK